MTDDQAPTINELPMTEREAAVGSAPGSLRASREIGRAAVRGATRSRVGRVAWLLLAGTVLWFWGPTFCRLTWPGGVRVVDFFQDWSTGRNYWLGLSIYARQDLTLKRHLGLTWDERSPLLKEGSTRPPSCVLLALPLGRLDYRTALGLWNLGGLCCLIAALGVLLAGRGFSIGWLTIVRLTTLALVFNPLLVQLYQGQWSLVLLLLVTLVWRADRRGKSAAAGVFLGIATAIKLFPAILTVDFLVRRNWRALGAWAVTFGALNLVALGLFGPGAFLDYVDKVFPALTAFRGHALDASIAGFWHRLFAPMVEVGGLRVEPIVAAPGLAGFATGVSRLAILVLWVWRLRRREPASAGAEAAPRDRAFAAGVAAMLLLAPLTWDHYLLLLLPPLVLLWPEPRVSLATSMPTDVAGASVRSRWPCLRFGLGSAGLGGCVALLFVPPTLLHQVSRYVFAQLGWRAPADAVWAATPWESLLILSLPTYVLLWLFALSVRRSRPQASGP